MSNEVQRTFMIKLTGFSLGMGALAYFVVGPKVIQASDMQSQLAMQTQTIAQGERAFEQFEIPVAKANQSMRVITRQMLDDLQIDAAVQAHQVIQRLAVSNGLTVTRVEPLQSTFSEVMTGTPQQLAKVEEKIFRIECQGKFAGFVAFVDELQNGPGRASVSSLRMVPTGEGTVSVIMSVQIVELIEAPEQLVMRENESDTRSQNPAGRGDEQ